MKLKIGIYPGADHHKWLAFLHPEQKGIALEFARRLAAFFRDHKRNGRGTSGHRSVERQKEIWFKEGGTYKNGKWIWNVIDSITKKKKPQTVAVPGNSWHNGRCGFDIADDNYWKAYFSQGDMHRTVKQQELYKYGLCLPLNYVDAKTVFEWWHIQPIETLGYTGDRTRFLDLDDFIVGQLMPTLKIGSKGEPVRILQLLIKDKGFDCGNPDGSFGPTTDKAVKAYQKSKGLDDDGIVGPVTWDKLI